MSHSHTAYILFFRELTYRSDASTVFRAVVAQTTRTRARMCLFGFRWHCSPFRG